MNPAAVLLLTWLAFHAGQLSRHRTIIGLRDQLEYQRQHVDGADQAIDTSRRIAFSAIHRGRRIRESAQ